MNLKECTVYVQLFVNHHFQQDNSFILRDEGKHSVATVDDVEKMKVHSHAWVVAYLQLH